MLYGKWRPRGFDEVAGQDHIITTLRNALATENVAHAFLFAGPRGTGKTTTARILARAVNCMTLNEGNPCDSCSACKAILDGAAFDLIEMDAASNRGIDDIREMRDRIAFAPADLKRKVYLLDEVHMLTDQAWNALLKTLEEPPPHAIFIFATTDLHKVPATIISRCQRFDFRRVPIDAIERRLSFIAGQEGFSVPAEGLREIAKHSRGGLRDAITLLEQAASRYGPSPSTDEILESLGLIDDPRTKELAAAIVAKDLTAALTMAREVADDGVNLARFTASTLEELRKNLLEAARAPTNEQPDIRGIATAIAELSEADFRRDPANPIPLEVACATAILGPVTQVQMVAAPPSTAGGSAKQQPAQRPRGGARPAGRGAPAAPEELSREERFIRELYQRCKMVNPVQAAWLNGSCEVIEMDGDEIKLGFYMPMHMQKVDGDCRELVEQVASDLLQRPVRLTVQKIDRNAGEKRGPRGGHLVEAARSLGATEIRKEED